MFLLDDGTSAGDWRAVAHLLRELVPALAAMGLQVSTGPGKRDVALAGGADSAVDLKAFPSGFCLRADRGFELLAAPVGDDAFCRRCAKQQVSAAQELLGALGALEDAQVAVHFLRQRASF